MRVRLARVKWTGKKKGGNINALLMVGGDEFQAFAKVGTPEADFLQNGLKPGRYVPVVELPMGDRSSYQLVELGDEFKIGWDEKVIATNADLLRKAYDEVNRAFSGAKPALTPQLRKDYSITLFISLTREYH